MILYEYHCKECDYVFRLLNSIERRYEAQCPKCDRQATKNISDGNFKLPGHDTGYPTAADKWARMHRKANKRELQTLGIPTD